MTKLEVINKDSCLTRASDNEPVFVLRAQDVWAPIVIRLWADLAQEGGCDTMKVESAKNLAFEMEQWPKRKYPGTNKWLTTR